MSNDLSSLSDEHVRQLGRMIEALETSTFDYLQLEVGDLKVTIGKGNVAIPEAAPAAAAAPRPAPPAAPPAAAPVVQPAPTPSQPAAAASSAHPGAVDVKSPIMGMFYAQPEPGAAPFVTVGASVAQDTTVGLVEVMKTFNAVNAGVAGKVVEVCVANGQLVDYGQVLFRVVAE